LTIGSGTNLLVGDLGIRGVVMVIGSCFSWAESEESSIRCGSGFHLSSAVDLSIQKSLEGIEFLTKIPGTVGGAVAMNTGTHNNYISRAVSEVGYISPTGERLTLGHEQMRFDYRTSIALQSGGMIEWVRFGLNPADSRKLRDRADLLARYRTGSQPYDLPNAGCAFRNPPAGFAGKLIEEAGLKGFGIGGVEVSALHANFIVNTGSTDSKDAIMLMRHVAKTVYDKFFVKLTPEIRIAGSWSIPNPGW
jgi:UDP-N-acetylmuramate dehydrogenase